MLNHVTWNPLARFAHSPTVSGPATVVAYNEVEEDTGRRLSASQQVSGVCICLWGCSSVQCSLYASLVLLPTAWILCSPGKCVLGLDLLQLDCETAIAGQR